MRICVHEFSLYRFYHVFQTYGEVKNVWSCASTSPYVFMPLCLIERTENLTCPYHYMLDNSSAQLQGIPYESKPAGTRRVQKTNCGIGRDLFATSVEDSSS
jgi:hypothetical protein